MTTQTLMQKNTLVKASILAVIGSLLLIASGKYQIPFWPVPITLQTLFVILIPLVYGLKISLVSVFLYFFYGLIGLPVFSNGGGPLYFIGPTAGYLYGFFLATILIGYFKDKNYIKNNLNLIATIILAEIIIFFLGVSWLANLLGWSKAIQFGLEPFVLGEIFKIIIVFIAYQIYSKKIN